MQCPTLFDKYIAMNTRNVHPPFLEAETALNQREYVPHQSICAGSGGQSNPALFSGSLEAHGETSYTA